MPKPSPRRTYCLEQVRLATAKRDLYRQTGTSGIGAANHYDALVRYYQKEADNA